MRRAIALGTATAASLLLFQVVSIATGPPIVVAVASVDGSPTDSSRGQETFVLALPLTDPAAIVLPNSDVSVATPTTQDVPPTTTTWAAATSTTTRAVPTSTTFVVAVPTSTVLVATTTTTVPAVVTTTLPATTTTAVISAAVASGSYSAGAESDFHSRINDLRASVGLAGLAVNGELNNYARWWAKYMADTGAFAHSDIASLLDPWWVVGENLGYGPTVAVIFDKLVASPLHYENIVDPRFTSVGVGAYVDSTGRIWTAHVFGA